MAFDAMQVAYFLGALQARTEYCAIITKYSVANTAPHSIIIYLMRNRVYAYTIKKSIKLLLYHIHICA
jgi:hypothetical protein